MEGFLPYIWFFLFALTLLLFVLLAGADLGIGILALGANESRRPAMLEAIGPLWYANETWLVIAGAILFAAFPIAYAVILSSLYVPAMALIFGLILRAVSIELRGHSRNKAPYGTAMGIGSLVAALAQGLLLGGILAGPKVVEGAFAGGPWDWLGWSSVVYAIAVAAGYAVLGAARLAARTSGEDGRDERALVRTTVVATVVLFIIGVAAEFPYIVPRSVTIREAASPARTLVVMLFGVGFILPVVMAYNIYTRRVFRGGGTGGESEDPHA